MTRLREDAHLSQEAAGRAIGRSGSAISRIEAGETGASVLHVRALCDIYRPGDPDTRETLAKLAIAAKEKTGWWEDYGDVLPDWMRLYVELEDAADEILIFEPTLVHGLLQTAEYATAVFEASHCNRDPAATQLHVDVRLRRQAAVLDRPDPPAVVAVFDEAALLRPVGGVDVQQAQVDHLVALSRRRSIQVRVLPLACGAHPAMAGQFTILKYSDPDEPAKVHLEQEVGAMHLEQDEDPEPDATRPVETYLRIFDLLRKESDPITKWRARNDVWQADAVA